MLKTVDIEVLNVVFWEAGPLDGWPVILLHGFPYDINAFTEVVPILAGSGARVIVPYLRGFGPTRFLDEKTPRSGEQAAVAHDLLGLMNSLKINKAYLVGYDWGGRAACIVAALWPERVSGLVSIGSYTIQDIASVMEPADPETEFPDWYQYYFLVERGRNALIRNRHALCQLLWRQWSPTWKFTDADFEKSAAAFANPSFVDVVIHSYRHRFGLVPGDPAYARTESVLTELPPIRVPSFTLDGADDGVNTTSTRDHAKHFRGLYRYRLIEGAGHNLPQEKPHQLANVIIELKELVEVFMHESRPL
ncbi:alpha/beta fold hydrolase [Pseudomonas asplenii]|uniref:alpha/beta fold hydrolase n=1 Tax=Pseudomonas asplenii TaxID=53407 RepID=UPI0022342B4D|nr:alpha/beta hydrolase [Pseudomonas asplenii]UZE27206.1 alpha/beta hydrolase [Pseudomonas asplenii]